LQILKSDASTEFLSQNSKRIASLFMAYVADGMQLPDWNGLQKGEISIGFPYTGVAKIGSMGLF